MTRKDAMLHLYQRLVAQRDELRQKLVEDLGMTYTRDDGINDLGETASHMEQSDLHSQLAALESRELSQIDVAIQKIRKGTYGRCDRCQKAIPLARLRALPFTSSCIECQRKREARDLGDDDQEINWTSAIRFERRASQRDLNLSDLDVN